MAYTERLDKRGRTSKTWRDDANPSRHRLVSCLGTPLHYRSDLDSDVYDLDDTALLEWDCDLE